ncbi:MAG: NTP transferase domain-containing protein [Desulfuromonadaceae bacterium]|nr:NTP transferase domain-containing protein [Desulfuromonadaceae bacterium]
MKGHVATVILAAGYSSRMGAFKPLLPFGDTTVLERAVALFRGAGIEDIRVVIGHCATELLPRLQFMQVRPLLNERYHEGMFSSVVTAAESLDAETGAFLLLPVDIPLVQPGTIELLLRQYQQSTKGVLYPAFRGTRGHPPLISASYRERILSWDGSGGLNGLLMRHESDSATVECDDEGILLDMDTPEDYQRLRDSLRGVPIPSRQACELLLAERFGSDSAVAAHCRVVAEVALLLAGKLNDTGCHFDLPLIEAAALLHDLAKGEARHAAVGAATLRGMGYRAIAELVAVHMELPPRHHASLDAAEILYLADKLVEETRIVPLENRCQRQIACHADNSACVEAIARRYERARGILQLVELQLGVPLTEVLVNVHP